MIHERCPADLLPGNHHRVFLATSANGTNRPTMVENVGYERGTDFKILMFASYCDNILTRNDVYNCYVGKPRAKK